MTTHVKAPDIPNPAWPAGGYPSKGKRLGPAWQAIWDAMQRADDALDGKQLADTIAAQTSLAPSTLVALLSRAAAAGLLTKESREVSIKMMVNGREISAKRQRMFYRIAEVER